MLRCAVLGLRGGELSGGRPRLHELAELGLDGVVDLDARVLNQARDHRAVGGDGGVEEDRRDDGVHGSSGESERQRRMRCQTTREW